MKSCIHAFDIWLNTQLLDIVEFVIKMTMLRSPPIDFLPPLRFNLDPDPEIWRYLVGLSQFLKGRHLLMT